MKTYNLDLRHAPSKRRLNALPGNRLDPLKARLADDAAAIRWAQAELLPFGQTIEGKDYRRLGRWVCNADGIAWRDSQAALLEAA
jgi:hypothetical protein